MIRRTLKALPTLLRVGLAEAVAYRAEFLVWMLVTNMPLIMLALWSAVAREHPVGAYGQKEFTAYFLSTLIVRILSGSWVVWEMVFELRQGTLAFRMLRPVHPLIHYAAENLASMPLRGVVTLPIAIAALTLAGPDHITHDPVLIGLFLLASLGAWALHFLSMAVIGCLGFFVESSLSLYTLWFSAYMVFSGYLMPVSLFPSWIQKAAELLPFRFMVAVPVAMLLGESDRTTALWDLLLQWGLVAGSVILLAFAWSAGARRFVAFGG